jgi:PAS domain S-box-containing protein
MSTNLIYILSYLLGGTILTIMIAYLWIFRKILVPGYSLLMFLGIWIWLFAELGEAVFSDFAVKVFFNNARFIGIILIPSAWFTFCLQYIEAKIKHKARIFISLFSLSFVFLILVFTNGFHHLVWKQIVLAKNNLLLEKDEAALYYVFVSYFYLLIVSGFLILFWGPRSEQKPPRNKLLPLLLISLIPLLPHVTDIFFPGWINDYEITPLGFVLASFSLIYYLRLRFFKIIPLTQHAIIESMSDLIIILNNANLIIYINPAVNRFFSTQSHEVIGKHLSKLSPKLTPIAGKSGRPGYITEEIVFNGTTFDASVSPILGWRSRPVHKILVLRDITRLKQTEESLRLIKNQSEERVRERTRKLNDINKALKTSLEEKNMLFRELHHRVKNNFQLINSMLKLQSYRISDKKVLEAFSTAINRIYSIAMIHEQLYRSEDFVNTRFSEYIQDLAAYITSSYRQDYPNISLNVLVDPILLDLDRSIVCGLIINELIVNAIKHAFPKPEQKDRDRIQNLISVRFAVSENEYILSVTDNGIGLPQQYDVNKSDSLGMKIIQTLTKQIKGRFEVNRDRGTEFKITFSKHV